MAQTEKYLDGLFLGLLLIEAAMTLIFLVDIGLGQPFGGAVHLLFDFASRHSLPTFLATVQLLAIGAVFALAACGLPTFVAPSRSFLLIAGCVALLLMLLVSLPSLALADTLPGADGLPWLGPALLAVGLVLRFGRHSLRVMWRYYPVASQIMLAGLWILLFGAVGVEILDAIFLRCANLLFVKTALEKFLEMAGSSVILYGVALFSYQKARLGGSPARC
ncbi:MAG: hypothetical protein WDA20_10355 [Desulfuromonadales bacterium]